MSAWLPHRRTADADTLRVRDRVRLLIELTAQSGEYRKGLLPAVKRIGPEEAAIISDLEAHGMQVPQLRDVLCGGHVLIDNPELYEQWTYEGRSHNRLSSHHPYIDKKQYPDIGMRGPVVREKLHGRTAQGTWIQLERTPAAFGGSKKLPTMDDLRHLMDYVVYRVTRKNVGPWGLSGATEKRPLYLAPSVEMTSAVSATAAQDLTSRVHAIEDADDTTAASADLARHFPPPDRVDPTADIPTVVLGRAGRGLFGSSDVWVSEAPASGVVADVMRAPAPPHWSLPATTPPSDGQGAP